MIQEKQLRLLPAEEFTHSLKKLSEAAKSGDTVAKFLHKWGRRASAPYILYGIYAGFTEQWWPTGFGLMLVSGAIYGIYDYFYERYSKKPEIEKYQIRKRVAFLERRPKVSVSWQ